MSVLEGSRLQLAQLAAAVPSSSFPFHWVVVALDLRGSRETDVGVACKARHRSLRLMDVVWQGISLCFTLARQLVGQRDVRTRFVDASLGVISSYLHGLLHVRPAQNILIFGQVLHKLKKGSETKHVCAHLAHGLA